jgi:preprotein translocase subunit SecF
MVSGAYSSVFIATPLLAQMKEREPDMKKLAARVRARRAKEAQKELAVEASPSVPVAEAEVADATAAEESEPSSAVLEEAGSTAGNGAKRVNATFKPDVRSHRDGPAKRPQPRNKPRSQRKK